MIKKHLKTLALGLVVMTTFSACSSPTDHLSTLPGENAEVILSVHDNSQAIDKTLVKVIEKELSKKYTSDSEKNTLNFLKDILAEYSGDEVGGSIAVDLEFSEVFAMSNGRNSDYKPAFTANANLGGFSKVIGDAIIEVREFTEEDFEEAEDTFDSLQEKIQDGKGEMKDIPELVKSLISEAYEDDIRDDEVSLKIFNSISQDSDILSFGLKQDTLTGKAIDNKEFKSFLSEGEIDLDNYTSILFLNASEILKVANEFIDLDGLEETANSYSGYLQMMGVPSEVTDSKIIKNLLNIGMNIDYAGVTGKEDVKGDNITSTVRLVISSKNAKESVLAVENTLKFLVNMISSQVKSQIIPSLEEGMDYMSEDEKEAMESYISLMESYTLTSNILESGVIIIELKVEGKNNVVETILHRLD